MRGFVTSLDVEETSEVGANPKFDVQSNGSGAVVADLEVLSHPFPHVASLDHREWGVGQGGIIDPPYKGCRKRTVWRD